MIKIIFLSIVLLAQPLFAQDFTEFSELLKKHLNEKNLSSGGFETSFNYAQAQGAPETSALLKKQVEKLSKFDPNTLKTKEEATAFWINAYNFYMVQIILTQGFKKSKLNIDSVKDFGHLFNPYKIFQKEINNIGGKMHSLDNMEKGILLGEEYKKKGWKDARIHFAVNCASVGCPPLIKKPYDAKTLNATLDDNIKKAFKTKRHFHIKGKELHLTHLFKWYEKDFKEHSGSVKAFLEKYLDDPKVIEAMKKTEDIEHIEYDWRLNKPENF